MNPWLILSAVVMLALLSVVAPVAAAALREWRRPWRLTCPRSGELAQIRVGAAHAALAEVLGRRTQIDRCSLWPERALCGQECLGVPGSARQQMRPGEAPPVARPDDAEPLIVVPLDGSVAGEAVLPAVLPIARGMGATLRLLTVVPPVKEVRDEDDRVVAWIDQETARVEREAHGYLQRVAATLGGVPVEEAVRIGDAAAEIVAESESAGARLIALAGRQRRRFGRMRRSGLSRRLFRATTIPVLVVSRSA
jgi:nucleotide-binding universal stress UspA family protein